MALFGALAANDLIDGLRLDLAVSLVLVLVVAVVATQVGRDDDVAPAG